MRGLRQLLLARVPRVVAASAIVSTALIAPRALAYDCNSPNPADWPPPQKPFFLIAFDTSGSMIQCTNPPTTFPTTCPGGATPNSCGLSPTRINDGKCALRKMVQAFSEVDFGLMSFPFSATCTGGAAACGPYAVDGTYPEFAGPGNRCTLNNPSAMANGCLPGSGVNAQGGQLLVGLPVAGNQPQLMINFTDDSCATGAPNELLPAGGTPINGLLRDAAKYLRTGSSVAALAPACRPVAVILVTDGGESCDGDSISNQAQYAARDLYDFGLNDGTGRNVKTYAIGFGGVTATEKGALDTIAKEGQCASADTACKAGVSALVANNEAELSIALSKIITGAVKPETCDNVDNNCNGCVDEGFQHYCNRGRTPVGVPQGDGQCCAWNNQAQRDNCVTAYKATISAAKPQGDLFKLPCWDPQAAQPLSQDKSWLCVNPGEVCDEADNNCEASITNLASNTADEGFNKCGSPLACPKPDTCIPGLTQGKDDDCDGIVDNNASAPPPNNTTPGSACPNNCVPAAEICDGKDNDCNGVADDGIAAIPCGLPTGPTTPPNCQGVISCLPPESVTIGGMKASPPSPDGTYFGACSISPVPEVCDGLDNDCNGKVDDGVPDTLCEIPGKPGLKYYEDGFPLSQCHKGTIKCNAPASSCSGYVGPSAEVCDGKDNDCDGMVDESDMGQPLPGVGADCGNTKGECKPGKFQCVGGALACIGGKLPDLEYCDGLDTNCNGKQDSEEAVFADQPMFGQDGCWPGTSTCAAADQCTFTGKDGKVVTWCKPPGGNCNTVGTLSPPCAVGKLTCSVDHWECKGGQAPAVEICDGVDNDCDGSVDSPLMQSGMKCNLPPAPATDWPANSPCKTGTVICFKGTISCVDAAGLPTVGPKEEICDGIDNDCNGTIDDMIAATDKSCEPDYDKAKFPGKRFFTESGPCVLGKQVCNGMGGLKCMGGKGPEAEVCDGVDNDCDGQADEPGPAPDGVNGTKDPKDPSHTIGDACGKDKGECKPGKYACISAQFVCEGEVKPKPETCNCADDDCDGVIDNDPTDPAGPICGTASGPSQTCVNYMGLCQCVSPCSNSEFPCPSGGTYTCDNATKSGTSMQVDKVCVQSPDSVCGDCAKKTVKNKNDKGEDVVECSPDGMVNGQKVPVCVCKGQAGCHAPCFNVACSSPLVCSDFGANAGKCVEFNCFNVPCPTGQLCSNKGECIPDPCKDKKCAANEFCKPSADFTTAACVKTCAGVTCPADSACKEGVCVKTMCPTAGCPAGQVCDVGKGCVMDKCVCDGGMCCPSGQTCNPVTGQCGASPCEGITCPTMPAGQVCKDGQCVSNTGTGGAAGASGKGGASGSGTTTGGSGPVAGSGTKATPDDEKGVIGLTTGGCGCEVPGDDHRGESGLALGALGLLAAWRRRRSRGEEGGAA